MGVMFNVLHEYKRTATSLIEMEIENESTASDVRDRIVQISEYVDWMVVVREFGPD